MPLSVDDFDYLLPSELIAQQPCEHRSASKMLRFAPFSEQFSHVSFGAIVDCLDEKDLLVFNDTKVFPARLFGHKQTGGKIECLVERLLKNNQAWVHLRSSKSPKPGAQLHFDFGTATLIKRDEDLFLLQFELSEPLLTILQQHGRLPLPPYIEREVRAQDLDRYQTVYADKIGAVAAPTAGLHFTPEVLASLQQRGVELGYLTLHVGAGTFAPVRTKNIDEHRMHREWFEVDATLCDQIQACKARGGRVVAVGTTVLRALETVARGPLTPYQGDTEIFITPGFEFRCVDALLTNFHLPKSTLLMLVAAFAGYETMMQAYQVAIAERYRFFSYGDCMLIA
jgi:S-adenosylmethionine:tRNA ribosyltransferase-isomerase